MPECFPLPILPSHCVVLSVDGETANQTVLIDFASACVVSGGSVCGGHGVCNEVCDVCGTFRRVFFFW